jgi:Protein of unknown function (DUF2795)
MTDRHPATEQLLRDIPLPATKKDLVRAAQRRRASDTLINALLDAEQVRFDSQADRRRALAHARRAGR